MSIKINKLPEDDSAMAKFAKFALAGNPFSDNLDAIEKASRELDSFRGETLQVKDLMGLISTCTGVESILKACITDVSCTSGMLLKIAKRPIETYLNARLSYLIELQGELVIRTRARILVEQKERLTKLSETYDEALALASSDFAKKSDELAELISGVQDRLVIVPENLNGKS